MSSIPINGPEKEWLTSSEVQSALGLISERQLQGLIQSGAFPRGVRAAHKAVPLWRNLDVAAYLWLLSRGCSAPSAKKNAETEEEDFL